MVATMVSGTPATWPIPSAVTTFVLGVVGSAFAGEPPPDPTA
jgi:hypothetical protein